MRTPSTSHCQSCRRRLSFTSAVRSPPQNLRFSCCKTPSRPDSGRPATAELLVCPAFVLTFFFPSLLTVKSVYPSDLLHANLALCWILPANNTTRKTRKAMVASSNRTANGKYNCAERARGVGRLMQRANGAYCSFKSWSRPTRGPCCGFIDCRRPVRAELDVNFAAPPHLAETNVFSV